MALENAIRAILVSDAQVAALVARRVHPIVRPQGGELPAVVYQRLTTDRYRSTAGPGNLPAALVQVTCWSDRYINSIEVADAVRDVLDGYSATIATVVIQSSTLEDENDVPSLVPGNAEANLFGRRLVFTIKYNE